MPAQLRLPTAALALALAALLACSLLVPADAAGAVTTDGVSGTSESTAASDSSTSASDDGNSTASTTEESTTATTAADSSESSSSDDSTASSTTTDDSGGSSSDSTTAGSSESSSEDSSTTASDSSTSDTTGGGSTSTTSEESGGSSTDSSTTDESGASSSDSSTTEKSGTNSSDSSTSEESSTSSSNSSTTEEPESSSTNSSTTEESTSDSSNSSTTEKSGTTSSNSSTTEESSTSSSNSSTTEESGTSSSNSSTTEESGTSSSNSSTTEESGTSSSNSSTTEESGTSSSNSSTTEEPGSTSSNSSTTGESGANSTSSDTTASSGGSSSNSTTDGESSSSNGTTSSSSSETTTGPGSSSGGNGTSSGSSNSGSAEEGSRHNVSNSGIFLEPGSGEDNYDITKKGEYFNCGGTGSGVNIRLVARYDKNATAEEMTAYLNAASDEYKAEEAMILKMPDLYQIGDEKVFLADKFTVSLARKVEDAKVEFEIFCKVTQQKQAEVVAANLTSTEPYSTWSNLRFSKACDMQPNRVVPVAMKFTDETYDLAMRDRSSEAFTSFVASIRLALLERLKSQVEAVQDVVVLSLSNGSVVAETAVMVDSSGDAETTKAVHTAADGTAYVNGKPTQSVETTQSEDYVAVMDTVNAAASGNASGSSEDTNLKDDKVPGITTESPNRVVSSDSNGYFLNVTVPSFLALILLIAIFLFCTVNSNSCLCQLCASNVKKEVKLV